MRSYLSKTEFFKKMKKKPVVQTVLDNIASYTEEQINQLDGPHFPQWVKTELIKLIDVHEQFKKRGNKTADDVAYEIAMKMIAASQVEKKVWDGITEL